MEDWSTYFGPLFILLALVSLALFSTCGAAFLSISRSQLKRRWEQTKNPRAAKLLFWREEPQSIISVLVIGDYISIFIYATLYLWWVWRFEGGLAFWGLIVLGALLLILVEIGMRTLGANRPLKVLLTLFPFLSIFRVLLSPAGFLLKFAAQTIFRSKGECEDSEENQVKILAEMREEVEALEDNQREMISAIFEFKEKEVSEVMVPRVDIVAIEKDSTLEQAIRLMVNSGRSRLPVFAEKMDNIVGILLEKDVLRASLGETGSLLISSLMREPFFVPESKRISELLQEMQRKKTQVALVVDEFGGLEGLVTMEDLLEEIVGEIRDEHDREAELTQELDQGAYLVSAGLALRDLNELMGTTIESEDFDTLGGLLYDLFQHIPSVGEEIVHGGLHFRVEEVRGNRLLRVRVKKEENYGN